MIARAFETLFLLAILIPPAVVTLGAIALGAIALALPRRRTTRAAGAHRRLHAAA